MSDQLIPTIKDNTHSNTTSMIEVKGLDNRELIQINTFWYNNPLLALALYFIGASAVGFIKYCWLVSKKNLKYKWFNAIVSALVSGVSGVIAGSMLMYVGFNIYLAFFFIGISGWMGVSFIEIMESVATKGLIDRFKSALFTFATFKPEDNKEE